MKRTFQNWVESQPTVQSLLHSLIFSNNGQNLHKSRYESFLVLSDFASFSDFLQNVLSLIACETKSFLITCPSFL